MWAFGYFVYVLVFAVGLYWASHREPASGRWRRIVLVAACALPSAWIGQMLLIPFTRKRQLDPANLLPNLAIAGYSVCVGLVSMWLLTPFARLRMPAYVLRYSLSDNAWRSVQLSGEGVPKEAELHCVDMVAPTTLLAVVSQSTTTDRLTQLALFDIDAGQTLAVVNAPFVTRECALGAGLLVAEDLKQDTVRAAMVELSSRSKLEVVPLPGLAGMLLMPAQIIPVAPGIYRLFCSGRDLSWVIQQWNSRHDKVDKVELQRSSVPEYSTRTAIDGHQMLIVGGQIKTSDERPDSQDPDLVDDVFRFDVDVGRLERLPSLLKPRLGPFVVQLADGRIMVGGGAEGGRRILWKSVVEGAALFASALLGLALLVLLAIKVPPQSGTLVLALLAAVIALALGGAYVFTQVGAACKIGA